MSLNKHVCMYEDEIGPTGSDCYCYCYCYCYHEASVSQIISPVNEHPISLSEINKRWERIKRSLFKSEEEIVEIESQTRQQSACQMV